MDEVEAAHKPSTAAEPSTGLAAAEDRQSAQSQQTQLPHRRSATWLVLAGYLVLAIVVTWRLWIDPASRTVVGNPGDADLFAWYMRYAAAAVSHGQLPALVTTALNAPSGINMMWNSSTLLPCALLAPVTLLFGPQASLTAATTAGFAGSAAVMFWVLRRWQVSVFPAALAGAIYGFSPALLQSAIGHYDLQLAFLPPLIIDAMLRIVTGSPWVIGGQPWAGRARLIGASAAPSDVRVPRERPWSVALPRHVLLGFWLGLLIAAQLFISEELALTTIAAGVLLVAGMAAGFPRSVGVRLKPTAIGAVVATCTTLALAGWALWVQFFGPLTQAGSPFLRDFYVNDLSGFVTPSSYLLFHTSASAAAATMYRGQAPEYLAYLGWPLIIVLLIAAVAFWANPIIRAVTGTGLLLALLSLGGYLLESGMSHTDVILPWHWVEDLPLTGSVLPDRLSILVDGCAAVLLALAVDLAWRWWRARARLAPGPRRRGVAMIGAISVLACLPLTPLPLPVTNALPLPGGWQAAFARLDLAPGTRILVVPVPDAHLTAAMRWAADSPSRFEMIGGYFIGPAWNGQAYVDGNGLTATAVYLDELWAAGVRPGSVLADVAAEAGLPPPTKPPAASQVHADLASLRPGAVVAVTSAGSVLARYLTKLLGPPTVMKADVLAWRTG